MSLQGVPDKPDAFMCTTCGRVVCVVVWQSCVVHGKRVTWTQCKTCWVKENG